MISVFVAYGAMAIILTAIIAGIVSDCKVYKRRVNALKLPKNDGLTEWLNQRDKIAFDELKEEV